MMVARICALAFTAMSALAVVACGDSNSSSARYLDPQYSLALLRSSWIGEEMAAGVDPGITVDVLQIFKAPAGEAALFDVDKIRSKEWLYESSDREFIRRFFVDAREDDRHSDCNVTEAPEVLRILAFDRDPMRFGYLRYYQCVGEKFGALSPYGTTSLYFSHSIAGLLESTLGQWPSH